jgi:putative zinc finger/helix-turn-helix YgiT family protein
MELASVPFATTIEHDGRSYEIHIPALTVPKCGHCGRISLDDEGDGQVSEAFRTQAGLLTPEAIRRGRERLRLTQKEFAAMLGVGEASVSRWETGAQIQQRALDRFVRVFFHFPSVRGVLARGPSVADAPGTWGGP